MTPEELQLFHEGEEGTHIVFRSTGLSSGKRAWTWAVVAKRGDIPLGEIRWYPPWRKYCYYPAAETVFEQVCLREIADFIEKRTKMHKQTL